MGPFPRGSRCATPRHGWRWGPWILGIATGSDVGCVVEGHEGRRGLGHDLSIQPASDAATVGRPRASGYRVPSPHQALLVGSGGVFVGRAQDFQPSTPGVPVGETVGASMPRWPGRVSLRPGSYRPASLACPMPHVEAGGLEARIPSTVAGAARRTIHPRTAWRSTFGVWVPRRCPLSARTRVPVCIGPMYRIPREPHRLTDSSLGWIECLSIAGRSTGGWERRQLQHLAAGGPRGSHACPGATRKLVA